MVQEVFGFSLFIFSYLYSLSNGLQGYYKLVLLSLFKLVLTKIYLVLHPIF